MYTYTTETLKYFVYIHINCIQISKCIQKGGYVFMDKKQKIERKMLKKIKNNNKPTRLNLDALRREVCAYQFHFANQPPASWNQSTPIAIAHNMNNIKNKNQQLGSLEVKK